MQTYKIPLVPGPVQVSQVVRDVYLQAFGAANIERDFTDCYQKTTQNLQQILATNNDIAIMTGEGMLVL